MTKDEGRRNDKLSAARFGNFASKVLCVAAMLYRGAHVTFQHGDTAPWLQALHVISWFAALRGLRGFHVFGVFTEARFAIAPGAVVERLLRLGHIRLIAFPSLKNRSL
jgi:hypothetical protein